MLEVSRVPGAADGVSRISSETTFVALAAALVFLDLNGVRLSDHEGRLYPLMMAVARGEKDKAVIAHAFGELAGQ